MTDPKRKQPDSLHLASSDEEWGEIYFAGHFDSDEELEVYAERHDDVVTTYLTRDQCEELVKHLKTVLENTDD